MTGLGAPVAGFPNVAGPSHGIDDQLIGAAGRDAASPMRWAEKVF
jgi:hypothetical protein